MKCPHPEPTDIEFPPHVALEWCRRAAWNGKIFRILLCDPTAFPELLGTETVGRILYGDGLILVSAADPRDEQDVTLLHELMHAAVENDGRLTSEQEERGIAGTDWRFVHLLRQDGWAPPPRPRGAEALEREARKNWLKARRDDLLADMPRARRPEDAAPPAFERAIGKGRRAAGGRRRAAR